MTVIAVHQFGEKVSAASTAGRLRQVHCEQLSMAGAREVVMVQHNLLLIPRPCVAVSPLPVSSRHLQAFLLR